MTQFFDQTGPVYSRRVRSLVFQFLGLVDILLGAAIAGFGPDVVGDPALDPLLLGAGALFALTGAGFIWWGRVRLGPSQADEAADTMVRTRR